MLLQCVLGPAPLPRLVAHTLISTQLQDVTCDSSSLQPYSMQLSCTSLCGWLLLLLPLLLLLMGCTC
jgi:hypothetical protein